MFLLVVLGFSLDPLQFRRGRVRLCSIKDQLFAWNRDGTVSFGNVFCHRLIFVQFLRPKPCWVLFYCLIGGGNRIFRVMLAKMELTHVLDICNFVAQSFQLKVPRLVHYLGKPRNRGLLTILVSTNAVRTGRTFDSSRNILQEPVNTDLIELRKQLLGMVRYGEL